MSLNKVLGLPVPNAPGNGNDNLITPRFLGVQLAELKSASSLATDANGFIIAGGGGGSVNNTFYVSSNGDDAKGEGSFSNPFKTVSFAMATLEGTTSATNVWSITFLSDIIETDPIELLPYVNINGNNYRWINPQVSLAISSWGSEYEICNFDNIIFDGKDEASAINLNMQTLTNQTDINFNNCSEYSNSAFSTIMTFRGNTDVDTNLFTFNNCNMASNPALVTEFNVNAYGSLLFFGSILVGNNSIGCNITGVNINNGTSSILIYLNGCQTSNTTTNIVVTSLNIEAQQPNKNRMQIFNCTGANVEIQRGQFTTDDASLINAIQTDNNTTFTTTEAIACTRGLNISVTSGTELAISAGSTSISNPDFGAQWPITVSQALVVDFTESGAGGLDTGVLTANNWYYIYLIYNYSINGYACMASLNPTTPLMPDGYYAYKRIGSAKSDSVLASILEFVQYGDGTKKYQWTEQDSNGSDAILDTGIATVSTAVPIAGGAPPLATELNVSAVVTSSVLGTATIGALPISGSSSQIIYNSQVTTVPFRSNFNMSTTASSIYYLVSAATTNLSLIVNGWTEQIDA